MSPRDREALEQAVVRGTELLKQGKIDQAQLAFRGALVLEPDNARVLALLALSFFRGNGFAEARAIYEQLVERAPTDASHRLNLGLVYLKLNDPDRAIAALETSRALDPSQGRAVNYLGLAYARAGRYGEAYRAFLIAGQNDLAIEIETNLTPTERDRIHGQLGRTPHGPLPEAAPAAPQQPTASGQPVAARIPTPRTLPRTPPTGVPRTPTPTGVSRTPTPTGVSRAVTASGLPRLMTDPDIAPTPTPNLIPRTKPPSAPPAKSRPPSHPDAHGGPDDDLAVPLASEAPEAVRERAHEPHGGSERAAPVRSPTSPGSPGSDDASAAPRTGPSEPARVSDSTQFVMPRADPAAPRQALDGSSMISHAVASATPLPTPAVARTRTGGTPPRPLSELATEELVRPDDGDEVFEIGPSGTLIIRVTERVLARLDGVHVTGGDLGYELAMRRSRGHNTDEPFDHGGAQLHAITGRGYLIAVPGKHAFAAVNLDDDILYLREDLVFAFEASLRWENGNVPGLRGRLPVVQFRGDGAVALRLTRPLVRVKLPTQGLVFVDADRLAGWIGRVIPRAVVSPPGGPLGTMCIECTGEGIVLVEPAGNDAAAAHTEARQRPAASSPAGERTPPDRPTRTGAGSAAGDGADSGSSVRTGASPTVPHASAPGDRPADPADDAIDRLDEL